MIHSKEQNDPLVTMGENLQRAWLAGQYTTPGLELHRQMTRESRETWNSYSRTPDQLDFQCLIDEFDYVSRRRQQIAKHPLTANKENIKLANQIISPELQYALDIWNHIPEIETAHIKANGLDMPKIATITRDQQIAVNAMKQALELTVRQVEKINDPYQAAREVGKVVDHIINYSLDDDTDESVREDMFRLASNLVDGILGKPKDPQTKDSTKPSLLSKQMLPDNKLVNKLKKKFATVTTGADKQIGAELVDPLFTNTILPIILKENPVLDPRLTEKVLEFNKNSESIPKNQRNAKLAKLLNIPIEDLNGKRTGRLLKLCVDLLKEPDQANLLADQIFMFMRTPFVLRAKLATASPNEMGKVFGDYDKALEGILRKQPIETTIRLLSELNPVGGKLVASLFIPGLTAELVDEARPTMGQAQTEPAALYHAHTGMVIEPTKPWISTKNIGGMSELAARLSPLYKDFFKLLFGLSPVRLLTLKTKERSLPTNNLQNLALMLSQETDKIENRNILREQYTNMLLQMAGAIERLPSGPDLQAQTNVDEFFAHHARIPKDRPPYADIKNLGTFAIFAFLVNPLHDVDNADDQKLTLDTEWQKMNVETLIPWILRGLSKVETAATYQACLNLTAPYMDQVVKDSIVESYVDASLAGNQALVENGGLKKLLESLGYYSYANHPHICTEAKDKTDPTIFSADSIKSLKNLLEHWHTRFGPATIENRLLHELHVAATTINTFGSNNDAQTVRISPSRESTRATIIISPAASDRRALALLDSVIGQLVMAANAIGNKEMIESLRPTIIKVLRDDLTALQAERRIPVTEKLRTTNTSLNEIDARIIGILSELKEMTSLTDIEEKGREFTRIQDSFYGIDVNKEPSQFDKLSEVLPIAGRASAGATPLIGTGIESPVTGAANFLNLPAVQNALKQDNELDNLLNRKKMHRKAIRKIEEGTPERGEGLVGIVASLGQELLEPFINELAQMEYQRHLAAALRDELGDLTTRKLTNEKIIRALKDQLSQFARLEGLGIDIASINMVLGLLGLLHSPATSPAAPQSPKAEAQA